MINNGHVARSGAVIFAVSLGLLCFISIKDSAFGLLSDAYVYLLLADFFSPFSSLDAEFATYLLQRYPYPPGYPILLGFLGGGSEHLPYSYFIDAVLLAGAVCTFYLWLTEQRLSAVIAGAIALMFLVLPATLLSGMGLMSEHAYLLTLLLGTIFVSRYERTKRTHYLIVAAGLLGLSLLVRTVGVAGIAALVTIIWFREPKRTSLLIIAVAVLPTLLWQMIKWYFDQSSSYLETMVTSTHRDFFAQVLIQMTHNIRAFWHYLNLSFGSYTVFSQGMLGFLGVLMLLGWLARLRNLRFDATYVGFYLVVLSVWPYPNHFMRFILVILPFLLFFAYTGAQVVVALMGRPVRPYAAATAVLGFIAIVSLPTSYSLLNSIAQQTNPESATLARSPQWHLMSAEIRAAKSQQLQDMLDQMSDIKSLTPQDACITSTEPHFIHFYAHRRSQKPMPQSSPDEAFTSALAECPYIFMMAVASFPPNDYPAMYPFHRIKSDMDVLAVSFFENDTQRGTVMTMLSELRQPH